MLKFSVIMPVYNAEKYVSHAIESVLSQTLESFELICINDGSSDKSGDICEKYAKQDSRVKVFHQKNGGISNARNKGISLAEGEYIAFIDNDDEYHPRLLEDNYRLASENNAEVVKYGARKERIDKKGRVFSIKYGFDRTEVVDENLLPIRYFEYKKSFGLMFLWNGIYNRAFLNEHSIRLDERIKYGCDDQIFNIQYYSKLSTLVVNKEVYYIWSQREGHSTSTKYNPGEYEETYYMCEQEKKLMASFESTFPKETTEYWQRNVVGYYLRGISKIMHPDCPFSIKEKIGILKEFYSREIFQQDINAEGLKYLKKIKDRRYLVAKLLLKQQFYKLLFIIKAYDSMLRIKEAINKK